MTIHSTSCKSMRCTGFIKKPMILSFIIAQNIIFSKFTNHTLLTKQRRPIEQKNKVNYFLNLRVLGMLHLNLKISKNVSFKPSNIYILTP